MRRCDVSRATWQPERERERERDKAGDDNEGGDEGEEKRVTGDEKERGSVCM